MTADPNEIGRRRRRSPRVVGPFTARWCGPVKVPLVLRDLSVGGCFILSPNTALPNYRMTLELQLPNAVSITVDAEPLYVRPGVGFAARFIDVPDATHRRLQRTIASLMGVELAAS